MKGYISEELTFMRNPSADLCVIIFVIYVDTGEGTLYTSDGSGIIFDESLKNHLYPNGYIDITDFYKVKFIYHHILYKISPAHHCRLEVQIYHLLLQFDATFRKLKIFAVGLSEYRYRYVFLKHNCVLLE